MRLFLFSLFLLSYEVVYCQTFIDDYKKFQGKGQHAKEIARQARQYDTVFKAHRDKTGFDFNLADSLTIVYQTSIESALSSFIIISGKDTFSYRENWKTGGFHSDRREIVYEPFLDTKKRGRFVIIGERDSILTLVAKRDCNTAHQLAKEHPAFDGSTTTIILVQKVGSKYIFEFCFLPPFGFLPIVRKE